MIYELHIVCMSYPPPPPGVNESGRTDFTSGTSADWHFHSSHGNQGVVTGERVCETMETHTRTHTHVLTHMCSHTPPPTTLLHSYLGERRVVRFLLLSRVRGGAPRPAAVSRWGMTDWAARASDEPKADSAVTTASHTMSSGARSFSVISRHL